MCCFFVTIIFFSSHNNSSVFELFMGKVISNRYPILSHTCVWSLLLLKYATHINGSMCFFFSSTNPHNHFVLPNHFINGSTVHRTIYVRSADLPWSHRCLRQMCTLYIDGIVDHLQLCPIFRWYQQNSSITSKYTNNDDLIQRYPQGYDRICVSRELNRIEMNDWNSIIPQIKFSVNVQ